MQNLIALVECCLAIKAGGSGGRVLKLLLMKSYRIGMEGDFFVRLCRA